MINVYTVIAIFGCAFFALLGQRIVTGRFEKTKGELQGQIAEASVKRDSLVELLGAATARLEGQKQTVHDLRVDGTLAAVGIAAPLPIDPMNEGLWPEGKPYFYVPKSMLRSASFQKFQAVGDSLGLHPDAAVALGMTPEQAADIDESFQQMIASFKAIEVERLATSDDHASTRFSTNWTKGKKTSFRLPPLKQELEPLIHELVKTAGDTLKPTQREIFATWAQVIMDDRIRGYGSESGRIFTFIDEEFAPGRVLSRFEVASDKGEFLYYYELWNPPHDHGVPESMKHLVRFPFHHLFGENGERRPVR
jgi:hypothetical protein